MSVSVRSYSYGSEDIELATDYCGDGAGPFTVLISPTHRDMWNIQAQGLGFNVWGPDLSALTRNISQLHLCIASSYNSLRPLICRPWSKLSTAQFETDVLRGQVDGELHARLRAETSNLSIGRP